MTKPRRRYKKNPIPNQKSHYNQSEKDKAQLYLDLASVIFVAIDVRGIVTMINKKGCEILGYKEKEIIGKNWFDNFLTKETRRQVLAVSKGLIKGRIKSAEHFENTVLTKSGQERMIAWHNTPIKNNEGNTVGHLSSGEDITERKEAENKLKESEERYALALQGSQDGLWDLNLVSSESYVSPRFENMLGYKKGSLRNPFKLWPASLHKEDKERVLNAFVDHLTKRKPYAIEYRVKKCDGTYIWVSARGQALWDSQGKPTRVSGSIRDISEQKEAEALLKESELKFKSLLENLPQKIFAKDRNSVYLYCNKSYADDLSIKPEAIQGKTDYDFYPKDLADKYRQDDKTVIKNGRIVELEEKYVKQKEEFFVKTVKLPLKDNNGNVKGIQGIFWDITERKTLEDAKNNLIRDISHGVKTPISMTEMAIGVGRDAVEDGDFEAIKQAQIIAQNNIRKVRKDVELILSSFTMDLKRLIDKKKKKKKKMSFKTIVNQTIKENKIIFEKKSLKVNIVIPPSIEKIFIDKNDLEIIINNIIDNALKFTKKGSITITSRINKKWIGLHIKDTGCGISEADKPHVFERFFKRHAAIDGSGLGLSICKDIVEMNDGQISIESKGKGKGTTVIVKFPRK